MARFRKKPIVIEAEQFFPDKKPWPARIEYIEVEDEFGADRWGYYLEDSQVKVEPSDWIVKNYDIWGRYLSGARLPVSPDIFEATYEEVEE